MGLKNVGKIFLPVLSIVYYSLITIFLGKIKYRKLQQKGLLKTLVAIFFWEANLEFMVSTRVNLIV